MLPFHIVNEGEYDGENYLFGLSNDSLYGEAIKETKVCILYKSDFNKLINLYPQLSCKLLQLNAYKSLEIEKQLQLLAIDSIEDRLATYISQLSPSRSNDWRDHYDTSLTERTSQLSNYQSWNYIP